MNAALFLHDTRKTTLVRSTLGWISVNIGTGGCIVSHNTVAHALTGVHWHTYTGTRTLVHSIQV